MLKSKVYVLYTGGTFGMAPAPNIPGSPLVPLELEALRNALPDHDSLMPGVELTVERFENLLDSSSMTPNDWVKIAEKINENYKNFDGFVVIQGTDTLAYTASALSFMLENLDKPVIVTGSQLPLLNSRTDATANYMHSLMIAAYAANDLPKIPEVVVVFADKIIRGCRTRKMSASSMAGFDSPNCPLIGEIGEHLIIHENQIRPRPRGAAFQINAILNQDVLDISLFPGFRVDHLESILNLPNVRGIVFRTYGTGNGPEDQEFLEALNKGIQNNNKVVVNITQCPQGTVEMGLYAASVGFIDCGMISGLDMTPEAALTKMMVTLGTQVGDQVKMQMQISQRGEQSMNLFDLGFEVPYRLQRSAWSSVVTPDRRFIPEKLKHIVLRFSNLQIEVLSKIESRGFIDVYMNYPSASSNDFGQQSHPRRVHRIELAENDELSVVETLSNTKVRNVIGDSNITLSLVPSAGVSFTFEQLSLNMFTSA